MRWAVRVKLPGLQAAASTKERLCSPRSNPKRTGFHPAPRSTRRAKKVGRSYCGAKGSALANPRQPARTELAPSLGLCSTSEREAGSGCTKMDGTLFLTDAGFFS
ncbi:hypothetical protein LX32DRAFT_655750 [Colletotrichum zoysiae]|uniref:Uncharacterized protein n=1 Tax=Colletotrichum zoysiae TaxID=1216348 RepID=A0AAD9M0L8_9PEZI|nr:hypothetical protein LX32DRAFT_655750 [Colletotrichum zoysiae]